MRKVNIRRYREGDETGILDIMKLSFPDWERSESPADRWNWMYRDNPVKSDIIVAEVDGKIVGISHAVNLTIKLGDRLIASEFGGETAVHPDFRGKGIYKELSKARSEVRKEKGVKLVYSLTLNPIVIKTNVSRGRKEFPHKISQMLRIENVDLYVKMKELKHSDLSKAGYKALSASNRLTNSLATSKRVAPDYEVKRVEAFDARIDAFWEKVKGEHDFILEKNSRFLSWRYDARGGEFRAHLALRGEEALGMVVSETKRVGGYVEGYITDLLALGNRNDVASILLDEACSELLSGGANAIYYRVVKGHPFQRVASSMGFVDVSIVSSMPFNMQYEGFEEEYELIRRASPSRVYFGYGDYL